MGGGGANRSNVNVQLVMFSGVQRNSYSIRVLKKKCYGGGVGGGGQMTAALCAFFTTSLNGTTDLILFFPNY